MDNLIEIKKNMPEMDDIRFQTKVLIQKKQIDQLRDTHGSQLERLSRNKEKLKALQIELGERVKYHKRLLDNYNEETQNYNYEEEGLELRTRYDQLGKEEDKKDELHLKILDKLTMNLDNLTSQIEKTLKEEFQLKERQFCEEKEVYSKPFFVAVCVKYIEKIENQISEKKSKALDLFQDHADEENLAKEKQEKVYFATFRISKTTTFKDLKIQAGEFWNFPSNQEKNKEMEETIAPTTIKSKNLKYNNFNNYELLDENYIEIKENNIPIIENFFQQKGAEFNQAMVILRLRENSLLINEADGKVNKDKKGEIQTYKLRNDEDFMYNEFHRRFPGMKKYIQITVSKVKKKRTEVEGFIFNDNHFCVFFWLMIMLILNLLAVLLNLNVFRTYLNNENISTLLSAKPNFKARNPESDSRFYSIINSESYYDYLKEYIAPQLFYDESDNENTEPRIYKSYVITGSILLRQVKISSRTCTMFSVSGSDCTYPYYTKDLRDENSGDEKFETEQTTKITEVFDGEFGSYDGSGYIDRFGPYESPENISARQHFLNTIAELENTSYIDTHTQAIFLQFNLFNPNQDLWTYVALIVEVCPTGTFFAFPAQMSHFKLNIYDSQNGVVIKVSDVLKGIICVFLLFFILYFVFCSRQMGEFNFSYLTSFQGICNLLIVVFSYITIYYSSQQSVLSNNENELFTEVNYTDLSTHANFFNKYFLYEGILIAVLILRVFSVFKINKRFNIMIKTLENAQTDIFNYSIILFPILLGFAMISQSIYGSDLVDFSTFGRSFISVLLLTVGQVNWTAMNEAGPTITLPFLLIFYMIIVFFLLSLFLGIYIDNYRTVVLEVGFFEKELSWTPKDYIKWMLHWMPKKCLKNLKLISLDENIKKYN